MKITTEVFGHVLVAHTPDELTEDTAPLLQDAVAGPVGNGIVNIVLQMDGTETYDSQGLESLLDLQDQLRDKGGNIVVSGLPETGAKLFEITRLDRRFDIFDAVIDAVSSFR